jgi:DNA integrity scanning protein DisA with diadenylate cyclase activity
MTELFEKYNQLIAKHNKAIAYFNKYPEQFDENEDKYRQLKADMVRTLKEIAKRGYVMCADEVLEGFRQIKYLEV